MTANTKSSSQNTSNRLGLDYANEAERFTKLSYGIIDVHTHLSGRKATEIYLHAARRFGIELTYSMTDPKSVDAVRSVLGDSVRFIVTPEFGSTGIPSSPILSHIHHKQY